MLKKSFLDFFNYGLAGMNPAKPHWLFFNSLLNQSRKDRAGLNLPAASCG